MTFYIFDLRSSLVKKREAGSKRRPSCHLFHTGLLLGLFFDPEDRGDMFIRNVD
jgi:hypothetical protein